MDAMSAMAEKAEQPTGNHFVFICNERMWTLVQHILGEYLSRFKPATAYMYSKAKNGYLDVGATFQAYEFGGNTISFKVDRTFSREYGMEKAYALLLDLTADKSTGEPAMQMFTLKGGDFVTNKFPGVGGLDGLSSGVVSSAVAASKLINWGYSGIAVFSPYRAYIMEEI